MQHIGVMTQPTQYKHKYVYKNKNNTKICMQLLENQVNHLKCLRKVRKENQGEVTNFRKEAMFKVPPLPIQKNL